MSKSKTVLITGATAGIGKSCAEEFAAHGFNVIITGRRKQRLTTIADRLQKKYKINVLTLCFDVSNLKEVNNAISSLHSPWANIDVLVNNAGLALELKPVNEGNPDDWNTMIDTNIKGLLYVSRALLPVMIRRKQGHIINIGSIAGKETYVNGNVYCASKHAVDSLTKGMRIDLLPHGIKVSAVHPGATETEFSLVRFKGDKNKALTVYHGFKPLSGKDVAEVVYYITTMPRHANINDLVITPTAQANTVHTLKKQSWK